MTTPLLQYFIDNGSFSNPSDRDDVLKKLAALRDGGWLGKNTYEIVCAEALAFDFDAQNILNDDH